MADRPKRKVEFIESYWTGGELGSDYQWSDNHGELIRCKDCKWYQEGIDIDGNPFTRCNGNVRVYGHTKPNWFCADGEKR